LFIDLAGYTRSSDSPKKRGSRAWCNRVRVRRSPYQRAPRPRGDNYFAPAPGQALSALYPPGTEEKRWVDGVLGSKKGLGF
jgi:hypothetical protein